MEVKSLLVRFGTDLKAMEDGFKKADGLIQKHSEKFKKVGKAMTVAGAAIVGSLGMMVKSYVAAGDEVHKMALRTSFSTEALSELKYAAEISGATLADVEKGIKKMSKTIVDASDGLTTYVRAFDRIGLTAEELMALSPEEQFDKISQAIARVENPTIRAAAAQDIFGRAGTKLLPLFAEGEKGLEALRAKAREMGIVFDQEAADKAAALNDAMTTLKGSFKGVTMAVAEQLTPIIEDIAEKITNMVIKVKNWIKENPILAGNLMKVVAAVGILLTILGPLLVLLPSLSAGFTILWAAITGPVGLVIAAVAAVAGAAYLIYKNWEPIKEFFIGLWEDVSGFFVNAFNSIKAKLLDWSIKIAGILEKIPIAKKLAGPWKKSLEAMRAEMDKTVENVNGAATAIGQSWITAIKGTEQFKNMTAAVSEETGFLNKALAAAGVIMTEYGEKNSEAAEVIAEANEKILSLTTTMVDEIKKATMDEYAYSKWALEQKLADRVAAIESEKASEKEKNEALALARESYRSAEAELDKKHREEEAARQKTLTEKMKENWAAFWAAVKQKQEEYLAAKENLTDSINKLTMSELEYTIWAFNEEYRKQKEHIKRTVKDENKKAELLSRLDEKYRLQKEKAHEDHAAKLTTLETNTLSALTTLYGGFINDTLQAFIDWGEGTKTLLEAVGTAFGDLATAAIQALKDVVVQELAASMRIILAEKAKAIAKVIVSVLAAIPFPLNLIAVGGAIATVTALFSKLKLGEGAIVMQPTQALIGERGPEAVIPLNKLGSFGGLQPAPVYVKQTNYFYGNISNVGDLDEISAHLAKRTTQMIERGRRS